MPVSPKYPGVYIEEIPSGVRTITGVSTATTAFVGRARKGPVNTPTIIHSYAEYERIFGGLWLDSTMSVALNQYFANGGGEAVIVRVFDPLPVPLASFVQWNLPGLPGNLAIVAASPGSWARDPDNLHLKVDTNTKAAGLYNITVQRGPDPAPPAPAPPPLEVIRNVSLVAANPSFITTVLAQQSQYIRVGGGAIPASLTAGTTAPVALSGNDGAAYTSATLVPATPDRTGIYALDEADIFNILVIPPPAFGGDVAAGDWGKAATYCANRRAMLLVDPANAAQRPDQVPATVPAAPTPEHVLLLITFAAPSESDRVTTGFTPSATFTNPAPSPEPSSTALVLIAATSEPRSGSDIENDPRVSPNAICGRYFAFCSSVPC